MFKKHADKIKKQDKTLKERGVPEHSYFHCIFKDNSEAKEHNHNWSDISKEEVVDYFGSKRLAMICTEPIKVLHIFHDGLSASIELNEGEQVYQSIKSIASFNGDGTTTTSVIGRVIGRIKDGKVIEELTIDGRTHTVMGIKL